MCGRITARMALTTKQQGTQGCGSNPHSKFLSICFSRQHHPRGHDLLHSWPPEVDPTEAEEKLEQVVNPAIWHFFLWSWNFWWMRKAVRIFFFGTIILQLKYILSVFPLVNVLLCRYLLYRDKTCCTFQTFLTVNTTLMLLIYSYNVQLSVAELCTRLVLIKITWSASFECKQP